MTTPERKFPGLMIPAPAFRKFRLCLFFAALAALIATGCAVPPPPAPAMVAPAATTQAANAAPTPAPATLASLYAPAPAEQREAEIDSAKAAAAREPMNWRVFNELGVVYYRYAMYEQAIAAFQQALALHPVTTTLENEAKRDEAMAAERAAEEQQRQAAIERAKEQQQQQQMSEIFGLVSGIANLNGNSSAQMLMPAMATLSQTTMFSPVDVPALPAEVKTESSLEDKREVAGIYANLGSAYFARQSYPEAVAAFDNVVQLDPSRLDVLMNSAEAQYRLCKYDECITMLSRYHAIAPVTPASLLLLSESYHALGMEPEADKVFGAFVEKQNTASSDPAKLMETGAQCLAIYRYTEAADFLNRAREAAAGSPEAAQHLADAQLREYGTTDWIDVMLAAAELGLSQTPKAVSLLEEVTRAGTNSLACYMLGRCYDDLGDSDKASEAYRKALQFSVNADATAPSNDYLQVCRAATGSGDDAINVLSQRLAGIPLTPGGGADQWCMLGVAYEKTGRIPEAMEILSRCHEVNPAYTRAGRLLEQLGGQAAADRERALADAAVAQKAGNNHLALTKLAEAYRLTPGGGRKEELRRAMLKLAAGIDPVPPLTNEAQDHYLRGNAALKAAKGPMDLGRSLSEFQWAVFYSPWVGDLYFNTSAVKKLQNQTAAAVNDLKLYLASRPNAKDIEEPLNRLYELDYQREQKLRELAAGASL